MVRKKHFKDDEVTELMRNILTRYNSYETYTERKDLIEHVDMVIEGNRGFRKETKLLGLLDDELDKESVSVTEVLGDSEVVLDRSLTVGDMISYLEKKPRDSIIVIELEKKEQYQELIKDDLDSSEGYIDEDHWLPKDVVMIEVNVNK